MRNTDFSQEHRDDDLLARLRSQDPAALEDLFDRYARAAYGLALRVCGDAAMAEDVVQEAFLSLWRRPDTFEPSRGSIAAYLFRAVHNKAVDAVRHEQALKNRERAGSAGGMPGEDQEVVVEEDWLRYRRERVADALTGLSDRQREAIRLAYFEGLTYQGVAERLGIPEGTAKTRIRDGMIRLRALLDEAGASET